MPYVFGPVPSRRLGLSLGIDLIPPKTCTFDCLYCQVGRTTSNTVETDSFVPVRKVVEEIEEKLAHSAPDAITLAGSGEPTLHSELGHVIASIKKMTNTRVALLTNGSLFWRKEIRQRALGTDVIMPTLTSAFEHTFQTIHKPHPRLELTVIIDGLKKLRLAYKGDLFLEVVILDGINDTEKEVEGLRTLIAHVSPEKIQLNTVVRPPADCRARALDRKRLEEIKVHFGETAEIVAEIPLEGKRRKEDPQTDDLLDMIKRRPLKPIDIAHALRLSLEEVEDLVKGLVIKGYIRKQEHLGDIYYLNDETDIY